MLWLKYSWVYACLIFIRDPGSTNFLTDSEFYCDPGYTCTSGNYPEDTAYYLECFTTATGYTFFWRTTCSDYTSTNTKLVNSRDSFWYKYTLTLLGRFINTRHSNISAVATQFSPIVPRLNSTQVGRRIRIGFVLIPLAFIIRL